MQKYPNASIISQFVFCIQIIIITFILIFILFTIIKVVLSYFNQLTNVWLETFALTISKTWLRKKSTFGDPLKSKNNRLQIKSHKQSF